MKTKQCPWCPRVSLKLFFWQPTYKTLSAEISGLQWKRFPDRFVCISHYTGSELLFEKSGVDYSGEGEDREVAGVRYKPACPGSKVKEVLILND